MASTRDKTRVLFLCTGNACRSQMAEGLLRRLAGDRHESLSAGSRPTGQIHPLAVAAMAECGIDIAGQTSKSIDLFLEPDNRPDLIISVCSAAERECPVFPAAVERLHWPFDDPAGAVGDDDTRMAGFRRVRDEIRARLEVHFSVSEA